MINQELIAPGIEPLIKISLVSGLIENTSKPEIVVVSTPKCPGIFLPLTTFPGV